MTNLDPWWAAPPTAGVALLILRRYVPAVWRNRHSIEQVFEQVLDDGTKLTSTVKTNDPDDLVSGPNPMDSMLATVIEQVRQLREHSQWQDERLDSAEKRTEAVERRLEDRDRRIAELEVELARVREENARLRGTNSELAEKVRQLEAELDRLRS